MVFTKKNLYRAFFKILRVQGLGSVVDPDPVGYGIVVPVPAPDPDPDQTFLTTN
jgi:hypothetical protein